jgi:hypothetical protein
MDAGTGQLLVLARDAEENSLVLLHHQKQSL